RRQESTSAKSPNPPPPAGTPHQPPAPRINPFRKLAGDWRAWIVALIFVTATLYWVLVDHPRSSTRSSPPSAAQTNQTASTTETDQIGSTGAGELETDLNGFRLLQSKKAVAAALAPYEKKIVSGLEAYRIDDDAYMVFGYGKKDTKHIGSIQLTG